MSLSELEAQAKMRDYYEDVEREHRRMLAEQSTVDRPAAPVKALAGRIEHAVLSPQATDDDLVAGVRTAERWGVRALVVKPCHVKAAARLLARSHVLLVSVVGFPHGSATTETKVLETRQAIRGGAAEIDMVLNLGALRQRQTADVLNEIRAVVAAADGHPVKVILETGHLTDDEKALACHLASKAGAAYVKTSTGFGPKGATVEDVALMRRAAEPRVRVKAAGGIHTYADAAAMIRAGADVIGTSATDAILQEAFRKAA
jgi:deoxyribose-phosphate aldolase